MAEIKPEIETFAKIKVVGVGGSGNASTNRMITAKIRGVDFIAMNTDVQALQHAMAQHKIHIGKTVTRGLGAGMDPEVGLHAAEESQNEIKEILKGSDMVFITCGLGGGTGTGAAPYVAQIAKELGALTVAVVTKPFAFEGAQRKGIADAGHERLAEQVDTIITIPNDRILQIIDRKTSLVEAFETVDEVLRQAVQGISELITVPGLINVDFADVRSIMANRGSALMGIGRGHGDNRAADAAKAAIASPLLEVSIDGAKGVLFTITGGSNLGMYEVSEAAKVITQSADPQAKVIFGAIIDETMKDEVKVTVIATGFEPRPGSSKSKTTFTNFGSRSGLMQTPSEPLEKFPFPAPRTTVVPPPASTQPTHVPTPVTSTPQEVTQSVQEKKEEEKHESIPAPAPRQPHVSPPQYAPTNTVRHPVLSINKAPLATKQVIQSQPIPSVQQLKQTEDDLEIPAFIRRKMI